MWTRSITRRYFLKRKLRPRDDDRSESWPLIGVNHPVTGNQRSASERPGDCDDDRFRPLLAEQRRIDSGSLGRRWVVCERCGYSHVHGDPCTFPVEGVPCPALTQPGGEP